MNIRDFNNYEDLANNFPASMDKNPLNINIGSHLGGICGNNLIYCWDNKMK